MNKKKRLLAVIGLAIFGILAAGAVILAVIGTETALKLLMADLFCLMVVPAVFYGYQIFLRTINPKKRDSSEETEHFK